MTIANRKGLASDYLKSIHAEWPVLRLTYQQFMKLPEYSATNPTGTTIGKRWRRLDGCYDKNFQRAGGKPRWIVCEYAECSPPEKHRVVITRYRLILICKGQPTS